MICQALLKKAHVSRSCAAGTGQQTWAFTMIRVLCSLRAYAYGIGATMAGGTKASGSPGAANGASFAMEKMPSSK